MICEKSIGSRETEREKQRNKKIDNIYKQQSLKKWENGCEKTTLYKQFRDLYIYICTFMPFVKSLTDQQTL